ncbi:hypothetical protein IV203_002677 [Nitzschia inconspicua]|uniref:DUF6824 domain-containing protein n=1 Tax=Nitzschia inconspicua TaxID=303405 RepID=A0A9K3K8M9_9STRA|nr:hypothetical protein IV203_002677 [Nitzschia inconspicua]
MSDIELEEGEASDDPSSDDGKVNFSQATAQPFNGQPGGKERNGANEIPRDAVRGSDLSPDDILLGRGVPMQRHPGNIRMHHLINSYRHQYRKASRSEKALMIQEVLQKLKEGGVRFRKRADNEDLWVEVSDQVAYDKISHALRGRGSERRAPPRESEVHLAGTLLSSPERLQHEGKCDIQHEVSMDGTSSAVAGKQPLRPGPGPLQMISESSSQNRGDHNAAANAINLSRLLLNSGNGTSRPDITLLSQRGEIQPSSLLTSGRSLAVTANMTSPIGAANLSELLDCRTALSGFQKE